MKNGDKKLELAKVAALDKNGQCLSEQYKGCKGKLLWKCSNLNHPAFYARYDHIVQRGQWCPECSKNLISSAKTLADGIDRAIKYASSRNGLCLSTEYVHSKQPLLWKCSIPSHYPFLIRYDSVIHDGHWCPECALNYEKNKKARLLLAKEYAQSKGGKCHSTEYIRKDFDLSWECGEHHTWQASFQKIVKQQRWCPECSKKNKTGGNHVR